MSHRKDKTIPKTLRIVCGVFFMSFSFVYLYFLQGDLLTYAQYVYSGGVTQYSIPVGALIITLLLMIVQWSVVRLQSLRTNYYALSYVIPSSVLAILTCMGMQTIRDFSFGVWTWLFPLVILLYFFAVRLLNKWDSLRIDSAPRSIARPLWTNAAILLALMLTVGSIGNTDDVFLYELKTERLITEGRYADAGEVGKKSLISSRRLTELRMYALARNGELGERMFDYPQYYGTAGLLDVADTSAVFHRIDADDVCRYFGVGCGKGIKSAGRYLDLVEKHLQTCEDTVHVLGGHVQKLKDYKRAYMLLDKDLTAFTKSLAKDSVSVMPRAYQEALLLYNKLADSITADVKTTDFSLSVDSTTMERYIEYETMKHDLEDATERKNRLRRKFGNTYWWYYDYAL